MKRPLALLFTLAACQAVPQLDDVSDPSNLGPGLPKGFLWGAATAGMTVEGGLTDTFTEWEKGSFPDGRSHVTSGQLSGLTADSWNRFDEDLAVVEALGSNVYRFSVEWSRLEPRKGEWDAQAMAHYRDWCVKLRSRGITPIVTLQHFTLPLWVAEEGGYETENILPLLEAYARRVAADLKGEVDWYVTINEPMVYAEQAYLEGLYPPGHHDAVEMTRVVANILKAHGRMAAALREVDDIDADGDGFATRISISHHPRYIQPATHDVLDSFVAGLTDDFVNEAVPRALKTGRIYLDILGTTTIDEQVEGLAGSIDYLALQYYTRDMIRTDLGNETLSTSTYRPNRPTNDLGWDIYPDGLYSFLVRFSAWGWPIVITENGVPDREDVLRVKFLAQHITAVELAVRDGANVRGYVHWALIDNFEPLIGWGARFGLYKVETESGSLQRLPTKAAPVFREIGERIPR